VIGLTGGIASGKSAFARMLAQRGSVVIDADSIGHSLLEKAAVRDQVIDRFGPGVLEPAGAPGGVAPRIDRKRLAAIVFADPGARRALEAILHPRMRAVFLSTIQEAEGAERAGIRSVVIDAAILMEAGWDELCDRIVFVDAPRDKRLGRALRQRGWSQETFQKREQAQWPCEEKRRRADFVFTNDGRAASLRREVDRLDSLLLPAPKPPVTSHVPVAAHAATPALSISKKGGF
jgi:dephospho-CoA kinase